jgi:hypothetical protein
VYQSRSLFCIERNESDVSALSRSASGVGQGGRNPRHCRTELGTFY